MNIRIFQSTLPRGERPSFLHDVGLFTPFQSTLPRGERRVAATSDTMYMRISIHAPARGATMAEQFLNAALVISIHAPARGATNANANLLFHKLIFQSTLPRGERQQNCTHSQYFFRELCESCQNLQITLTNYSFFYLIICFLQSFSSANQLVFSCSLIIRTN